jgi:hypothetical protein
MLKEMKSHCHLKPGQKGTKRLVEQYGESLLRVRYRYDETRGVWHTSFTDIYKVE